MSKDNVERRRGTEVRLNRIETDLEQMESWVRDYVKGALSSANNDWKTTHDHILSEIRRIDDLIRGEHGDNGLSSRVKKVEDYQNARNRRQIAIEVGVILAVAGAVASVIVNLVFKGTP